jgi:hypothetical protein
MPGAGEILNGLSETSVSWKAFAILWHIYFAVFAIITLSAFRTSNHFVAAALVPPLASVGALAWIEGNPFNGAAFCLLSVVLLVILIAFRAGQVERAPPRWLVPGLVLAGFGWAYPHFLDSEPWTSYLYASPLGLIPCPSLSMVLGITMVYGGLNSRIWSLILALAAIFYGVFGSLYLGVTIDWVLAGGGIAMFGLISWQASGGNARAV